MKFIPQVEPWLTGRERARVDAYLRSGGWITEYKETGTFERRIAELVGATYAVATTSGTSALILALMALELKPGDKVIVPNITMVASPNAVRFLGGVPVFADVDPETLCIDVRNLTVPKGTRALMHVSLNGRSGDMRAVKRFCKTHGLYLIEDSCQAFGSQHAGRFLGTFGDVGCYSFSPHKIITTGQGGAVVTNTRRIYEGVKRGKDFGRLVGGRDFHESMGLNFKFTDLQAAFGLGQLSNIRDRIRRKKRLFEAYRARLSHIKDVEFVPTDLRETSPWFVDILVPARQRDALMTHLKSRGIGSRPMYPPLTSQPIYRRGSTRLPFSESLSARGLWLPSSCTLSTNDIDRICDTIQEFFHHA